MTDALPLNRASVVLAREIVDAIRALGLGPGDRYLSEAEALRTHRVGRGTYREALRLLEVQGVVVMRAGAGGGPEIRQPGWPNLASTLGLVLQFAEAPLLSVLDARVVLEPGTAELAATHATADDLATMAADLDVAEGHLGDRRTFTDAYLAFWQHLAEATHNAVIAFLSPALRAIVNSAGFVPDEPYREQLVARLREIHAAVAAHDADAARELMRALELEFRARLQAGYPRRVNRVVGWNEVLGALADPDHPVA